MTTALIILALLTVLGVLYLGLSVVWFVVVTLIKVLLFGVELLLGLGWWVLATVGVIALAVFLAPGLLVLGLLVLLLFALFGRRRPHSGLDRNLHSRLSRLESRTARFDRVMSSY